jgi:hypothetical protein
MLGPHFSAGVPNGPGVFLLSEALWTSWTMCTKSLVSRRESLPAGDHGFKPAGKPMGKPMEIHTFESNGLLHVVINVYPLQMAPSKVFNGEPSV